MKEFKTALCLGGNGFICHHMARRLKSEGYWVRVVDIKYYEYGKIDYADEVVIGDLRDPRFTQSVIRLSENLKYSYIPEPYDKEIYFDEVYQMGADMGGSQYVFTGEHDAEIMHNSALINLNVCNYVDKRSRVFYSSSACMYPQELQGEKNMFNSGWIRNDETGEVKTIHSGLKESMAYPANPDSEYGWEKLFSERLYLAYARNKGLDVRIARFHNIYGPEGTYKGGREKAPAAMCRKVIECKPDLNNQEFSESQDRWYGPTRAIEVWGTGQQTRSFLYIDDCIDAVRLLMQSDFKEPINIGSEEMVSINDLAKMAIELSGKDIKIKNVESNAIGVRGRNSDNTLIRKVLGWEPKYTLRQGLEKTYKWIKSQYNGQTS